MADELLNCPFCGAPAELKGRKTVMVSCTECSASTFQLLEDKASAIRQWNTRHQPNGGAGAEDARDAALRQAFDEYVGQMHGVIMPIQDAAFQIRQRAKQIAAMSDQNKGKV